MSLDSVLSELTAVIDKYPLYAGGWKSPVIIVFGATKAPSQRSRCIERLREVYPAGIVMRPEDCWTPSERVLDLAEFEAILTEISDCTIIFPESPGSYAETGYFSAKKPLREKLLVASPLKFQTEESFLNRGPFQAIDRDSAFKNCLWIGDDFSAIESRLARLPRRPTRILGEKKSYRDVFYLTWLVVWLCQAIRDSDAKALLSALTKMDRRMVVRCLEILTAVGVIQQDDSYYLAREIQGLPHMGSKVDRHAWRVKVSAAIVQHDPAVMQYLGQSSTLQGEMSAPVRA